MIAKPTKGLASRSNVFAIFPINLELLVGHR